MKSLAAMTNSEFIEWYRQTRNTPAFDDEDRYDELNKFILSIKKQDGLALVDLMKELACGEDSEQWSGWFACDIFTAGFAHGWDEAEKSGDIDLQPEENLRAELQVELTDKVLWLMRIEALKLAKRMCWQQRIEERHKKKV